jgi:translocation and assembly module TamB
LTGNASLETEIGRRRAVASLYLEKLDVLLPESTGRTLQSLDPHPDIEIVGAKKEQAVARSPYLIQIDVDGSNGFQVRRADFEARVEAGLDVIYLDPELRVGGYVDFQHGTFEVFGKSFQVNRGSLNFDGSTELNPAVSLSATYRPEAAGSSPVLVTVAGTMNEPVISFVSDECEGEEGALSLLVTGRCAPSESEAAAQDTDAQRDAFLAGMMGGVLTLGTSGVRGEFSDLIPKPIVERTGTEQYRTYRIGAGINADSLIPGFLRPVIRGVYLESAFARQEDLARDTGSAGAQTTGESAEGQTTENSAFNTMDFLLELRFPYNLVWSGKIRPPQNWGTDLVWEP